MSESNKEEFMKEGFADPEFKVEPFRPFSSEVHRFRELAVELSNESNDDLFMKHAERYAQKSHHDFAKGKLREYAEAIKGRSESRKEKITATFLKEFYQKGHENLVGDPKIAREFISQKHNRKQIEQEALLLTKGDLLLGVYQMGKDLRRLENVQEKLLQQLFEQKQKNQQLYQENKSLTNQYNQKVSDDTKRKVEITRAYDIQKITAYMTNKKAINDFKKFRAIGLDKSKKIYEGVLNPKTNMIHWIEPSDDLQKVLDQHIMVKEGKNLSPSIGLFERAQQIHEIVSPIQQRKKELLQQQQDGVRPGKEIKAELKLLSSEWQQAKEKLRPKEKRSQGIKQV